MSADGNIQELIPQRPPFVMVGRLLLADGQVNRTSFRIPGDNVFVVNGRFTEGGLLENIAQTAAAGAGDAAGGAPGTAAGSGSEQMRVGYIGAVKNLEIFDLPGVGDELITETRTEDHVFDVAMISGKVWCNERLMAQCEMKIFMPAQ